MLTIADLRKLMQDEYLDDLLDDIVSSDIQDPVLREKWVELEEVVDDLKELLDVG